MSRWQPLSESLHPDVRLLVEQLRRLKLRTGLSLVELAESTPYSKSAWHRYLSGDKFPPRQAVEALGVLAGADAARLMGLWGLAQRAWTAPTDGLPQPTAPPAPEPSEPSVTSVTSVTSRRWHARRNALVAVIGAALLALPATVFAIWADDNASSQRRFADSAAGHHQPPPRPADSTASAICRGLSCQGQYPNHFDCEHDARTEDTIHVAGRSLRLRFSASCGTAWAEVSPYSSDVREMSISESGDDQLTALPNSRSGGSSPMLAVQGPQAAEACAIVSDVLACAGGGSPPADTGSPADNHGR
ncbi:MAG: hypothetical protein QOI83_665 [Streptomycetaceae bacterium]|nr:hypothetical protein [Streptomycetaceae bacterium]